jgi:hypothetical protein
MTNLLAHATALQAKWRQRGEALPHCDHLSQKASLVVLGEDGYVTSTYHCLDCGVALVRSYKATAVSGMPLDRVIRYQNTFQA